MLGRQDQTSEAQSLFDRALKLLDQARTRSPKDEHIRRMVVQTLASHAEFLERLGKVRESLADWDRAVAMAVGTDVLELRLGRAATLAPRETIGPR